MEKLPQFGRYETRSELGRGGMAVIYCAYDPDTGREVALKAIAGCFSADEQYRRLFKREARVIASLEHSAIVRLYDFGDQNDQPYLVMRFMPGGSLASRLRNYRPVPLDQAAKWLSRLAPALDLAHRRGIVHRDLKPGNILFDEEGQPYIADFGIAKLIFQTTLGIFEPGEPVGTDAYMSPELARGDEEIDGRSDIYSLGVILFELLAGRRPYRGSLKELIELHIKEPVPDILEFNPNLPPECQQVIAKAMAKQAEARYATAREMVADLKAIVEKEKTRPVPVKPVVAPQPHVPREGESRSDTLDAPGTSGTLGIPDHSKPTTPTTPISPDPPTVPLPPKWPSWAVLALVTAILLAVVAATMLMVAQ